MFECRPLETSGRHKYRNKFEDEPMQSQKLRTTYNLLRLQGPAPLSTNVFEGPTGESNQCKVVIEAFLGGQGQINLSLIRPHLSPLLNVKSPNTSVKHPPTPVCHTPIMSCPIHATPAMTILRRDNCHRRRYVTPRHKLLDRHSGIVPAYYSTRLSRRFGWFCYALSKRPVANVVPCI